MIRLRAILLLYNGHFMLSKTYGGKLEFGKFAFPEFQSYGISPECMYVVWFSMWCSTDFLVCTSVESRLMF